MNVGALSTESITLQFAVSIVWSNILSFQIIVFCIAWVISFLKDVFLKVAYKANIHKALVLVLPFYFKRTLSLQNNRKIGNILLHYVFLSCGVSP